ncbi:MAG: YebC/PmpR family DNA-binding transcriptional regulator [Acidobacteria bacterium]|nr:MAG: YebC/PmpR family DNA-binding transcriptional regulator [Acidobacteriota bacterium]PIE90961.1 MAG: YebC/PmpR family DNA-binding transcriptional regulator [Acidobacteriota bacterium]
MAGHSKWANIQHRKGREDAKRGKLFTKLVKEITIAARMGGGDPDSNPRLRAAITSAKSQSMPNDNIKRAVDKGTGKAGGDEIVEITYEGYGPAGVAVIVEAMTDNKNRTTPEIRHAFSKAGGNLGENGSVAWQFKRTGYVVIPKNGLSEDEIAELTLEAGAEDYEDNGENWAILSSVEDYSDVLAYLEEHEIAIASSQLAMIPTTEINVNGDNLKKVMRMIDRFEDMDDVQNVWTNADFDEAEIE